MLSAVLRPAVFQDPCLRWRVGGWVPASCRLAVWAAVGSIYRCLFNELCSSLSGVDFEDGSSASMRLSVKLQEARERGFVGRSAPIDAFAASLSGLSDARVHFVHGLGGIGKSTLLDALARRSWAVDRAVVRLDARDVMCSATAVMEAIDERTAALNGSGYKPTILFVDGYERLAPLDRWFREELLPSRHVGSVTVLAGRDPPETSWRLDPGWSRLVVVHALTELDRHDSTQLLARLGVDENDRDTMADLARGHPLVLAMLAEAGRHLSIPASLGEASDLVGPLCHKIIDDIPTEAHRTGLATCAHVSRMTQDLLSETVGPRAAEVWDWLVSRPYVRRGEVGLFLHDVVRELFEADIAHRSPDSYASLHRVVRGYFVERLVDPAEPHPDRAAAEILLLLRRGPLSAEVARLREGGVPPVVHASLEEAAAVVDIIGAEEGPAAARIARRWIDDQRTTVYRIRSDSDVEAFSIQVVLPSGTDLDVDDPVAAAVLREVARRGPLRPGERILLGRFAGSSRVYHRDPLVFYVNSVADILEWVRHPSAWNVIVTIDADYYGPFTQFLAMDLLFTVPFGGNEVSGYGCDRRRFPIAALLELLAQRELSGETGPPPLEMIRPAPLSHEEFAAAVRSALHLLGAPHRLASSPLLRTSVGDAESADPGKALRATLTSAIGALATDRRGEERVRVLEQTFLGRSRSQEHAAEQLDLPFSTYRRYLAQAQDGLIELLWATEIGERPLPAVRTDVPEQELGRS